MARDYRSREIDAIYGAEGTARIGLALEVQKLPEIMWNPGKSAARSINELSSYTRKDQIVTLPLQRRQQILGKDLLPDPILAPQKPRGLGTVDS